MHGGAEAVRAVQLARGLAARDADDFVRRAPLDNFRNQNRSNDKFRPSVQSSLGVVDVENSTAAGQDVGAGGKSGNRVEAAWGGEGEFNELEATLDGGVHGVVRRTFDARAEDSTRLVLGKLIEHFVELGVGSHVRLVTNLLAHRSARAERIAALRNTTETGASARVRGGVRKLARVVALAREQLAQRRVLLDLAAHKRIKFARRTRICRELRLHDILDNLSRVRDIVHLLRVRRWNNDNAVLIADDRIARSHDDAAARDDAVRLPRLVHVRSLSRRRRNRKHRKSVLPQHRGVSHASIGH